MFLKVVLIAKRYIVYANSNQCLTIAILLKWPTYTTSSQPQEVTVAPSPFHWGTGLQHTFILWLLDC